MYIIYTLLLCFVCLSNVNAYVVNTISVNSPGDNIGYQSYLANKNFAAAINSNSVGYPTGGYAATATIVNNSPLSMTLYAVNLDMSFYDAQIAPGSYSTIGWVGSTDSINFRIKYRVKAPSSSQYYYFVLVFIRDSYGQYVNYYSSNSDVNTVTASADQKFSVALSSFAYPNNIEFVLDSTYTISVAVVQRNVDNGPGSLWMLTFSDVTANSDQC